VRIYKEQFGRGPVYVSLPYAPLKLEIKSDGSEIYVLCGDNPTSPTTEYILIIDTTSYTIENTVTLSGIASSRALTGDNKYYVVSYSTSKTLVRYDTGTWTPTTFDLGSAHPSSTPYMLSTYYDQYANGIWIVCNDKAYDYNPETNTLGVKNVTLIDTGKTIDASSYGSSGCIYVGYSNSNNITRFNSDGYLFWNATIPGAVSYIRSVKLSSDGSKLYATNSYDNKVYVINTINGQLLGYINTGWTPIDVTVYPVAISSVTQQVTFTVQTLYGAVKYSDVDAVVYDEYNRFVYNGITGIDGKVIFELNPKNKYTVTFTNTSRNINKSITMFPTNTAYYVDIGVSSILNFNQLWHSADTNSTYILTSGTGDPLQDITLTVNQSPRNIQTDRWIKSVYNDDSCSTVTANHTLYVFNSSSKTYEYVTSHTSNNNTYSMFNFSLANTAQSKTKSSYKIVVNADTQAYGTVQRVAYIEFDGSGYLLPGLGLDNKALPYEWICFGIIFLIIIIGTFMSNGIIIFIAGAAWEIMIAIGWMGSTTQNLALGALMMAIGAGYVLMQKRREVV
jgi:YVTN family beta-propeller protein